jgi:molecular chaperone IbpA
VRKPLNREIGLLTHASKALDVRAFRTCVRPDFKAHAQVPYSNRDLAQAGGCFMRTIDFTPLYRSAVGFDRLAALLDAAAASDSASGYPPYNIERTDENAYRIEIAVAGFKPEELTIEAKENVLTVQGRKTANDETRRFLHRGLAERNFERRFQLADYVVVTEAQLTDGLLAISLKRELPEQLKPRRIEIQAGAETPALEADKAA